MARTIRLHRRWLAALCGLGLLAGVHYLHLDDRTLLWISEQQVSASEQAERIWLPGYHVSVEALPLAGLEDDEASDLSYNPRSGTLFTVTGKLPMLVELSREGQVLRRIALNGFANPEGVAVLEDGRLAIVDERRRSLSIVELADDALSLDFQSASTFDLGFEGSGNKGFEGIAWDPGNQRLLLGKERQPTALFSLGSDGRQLLGEHLQALPSHGLGMRNLSALALDPHTGHLLALSAQSSLLLELDEQGEPLSFISLLGGHNGLKSSIPRAEGVAIDEQGTLYMVSEPNLFYVFQHRPAG